MNQKLGRASVRLERPVYILNSASVVGTKEGQGPLGLLFDKVGQDDMFGCKTWEEAESTLQKEAVGLGCGRKTFPISLRVTCWVNPWPLPSASLPIRFPCWACTAPAPPAESRWLWGP